MKNENKLTSWVNEEGKYLTKAEYYELFKTAIKSKIKASDYIKSLGYRRSFDRNRSRETIVMWLDNEGKHLMLREYNKLAKRAERSGISTKEYLEALGYTKLYDDITFNDLDGVWVDEKGSYLSIREYNKLAKQAQKAGMDKKDYIKSLGYTKIALDSQRKAE